MPKERVESSDLFDPFPRMETPRLVLRATEREDAAAMFDQFSDARFAKYLGKAPPASIDAMHAKIELIFESRRTASGIWWTLEDKETGQNVGGAGIWRWEKEHFRGEVGYDLRPSHWGRGLVPEALAPILAFGFERMKLHSIEAKVHPGNHASIRVLEKLGFVKEAHFLENYYNAHLESFEDTAIYSLVRGESAGRAAGSSGGVKA